MERRTAQSCSSRFSIESGCMQACVLGSASVDGVCGGSHAHGNCTIALRLTRGYRKWRRSRVTPRTHIESTTGKSTSATDTDVKGDTALNCVAVPTKSASDLSGFNWSLFCMYEYHCLTSVVYKRREWTGRPKLCCRRASLGGAECHRRIDGIGRHGTR